MSDQDRSTVRTLDLARLDPGSVFGNPEEVLHRADLTTAEKVDILRRWEYDAAEVAVAEEEGMRGSENDLLRQILLALETLTSGTEFARTGPTKQRGII
jgi:hypothetical protein